jgi:hypothetical protein
MKQERQQYIPNVPGRDKNPDVPLILVADENNT